MRMEYLLTAVAVTLGAACSGRATAGPADPNHLFRDDFSTPTSGWDRYRGPQAVTDYADGRYVIAVNQPGVDVWATPGLELPEAVIEVVAVVAAVPGRNEHGIICRYYKSGDKVNFYFFVISSDREFAVGKVVRNQRTYLTPGGEFQIFSGVATGAGRANRLVALCQGSHFEFSINGQPAAQFDDDSLQRGGVGLLAGTFAEGGLEVRFDDFLVNRP